MTTAGSGGRWLAKLRPDAVAAKAKEMAASLKTEYEAGKRGDDGPTTPLWAGPREQLDAVVTALHRARPAPSGPAADRVPPSEVPDPEAPASEVPAPDVDVDADAEVVATALRGVDWAAVRAATAERTTEATRTVRTMAEQVDWTRLQPVAARVSSSLIAAVASGQLGVGGPLGSTVARAIVDQRLTQRVAERWTPVAGAVPTELDVDPT